MHLFWERASIPWWADLGSVLSPKGGKGDKKGGQKRENHGEKEGRNGNGKGNGNRQPSTPIQVAKTGALPPAQSPKTDNAVPPATIIPSAAPIFKETPSATATVAVAESAQPRPLSETESPTNVTPSIVAATHITSAPGSEDTITQTTVDAQASASSGPGSGAPASLPLGAATESTPSFQSVPISSGTTLPTGTPTPNLGGSTGNPSGSPAGAIAGVIVSIIAVIALLLLIYRFRRSRAFYPVTAWLLRRRDRLQRLPSNSSNHKATLRAWTEEDLVKPVTEVDNARESKSQTPSPPDPELKPSMAASMTKPLPALDQSLAEVAHRDTRSPTENSVRSVSPQRQPWTPTTKSSLPQPYRGFSSRPAASQSSAGSQISLLPTPLCLSNASPSSPLLPPPKSPGGRSIMSTSSYRTCASRIAQQTPSLPPIIALPPVPSPQPPSKDPESPPSAGVERRHTGNSAWSDWFGASSIADTDPRSSVGSIGALSIASTAVLSNSILSGPGSPTIVPPVPPLPAQSIDTRVNSAGETVTVIRITRSASQKT